MKTKKNLISNEIVSCATLIKVVTLRCFNQNNFEITPEQYVILDTILEHEEKNEQIYQRKIGEILGKDRANVARLLNILEEKNLIKKEISSNGRQINNIKITPDGKNLRNKILPVITKIRESYLEDINYEELMQSFQILSKIKENISKNTKLQT